MAPLTLEVVEGPGAGRSIEVDHPIVIGRSAEADFTVDDNQASRRHARVSPATDGSLVVEDMGSANGTFVNHNELHGPARLDPDDELLIGVSLIQVRSRAQVAAQPSAIRVVPAAMAVAESPPQYVNEEAVLADPVEEPISPELDRYRDVKVKARAQFAPVAFIVLIAIVVALYFVTH